MNILLVLIPVTLVIVIVAIALFFWAVNHQQFDDLESPGVLPLLEDDQSPSIASTTNTNQTQSPPGCAPDRVVPFDATTRANDRNRSTR